MIKLVFLNNEIKLLIRACFAIAVLRAQFIIGMVITEKVMALVRRDDFVKAKKRMKRTLNKSIVGDKKRKRVSTKYGDVIVAVGRRYDNEEWYH